MSIINFAKPCIEDGLRAVPLLTGAGLYGCEYSFGNNYMWSDIYGIEIGFIDDIYVVKNDRGFLFPTGSGDTDIKAVTEQLRQYNIAGGGNGNVVYTSMDRLSAEKLTALYGDNAAVSTNRDYYDYAYDFEQLSALKGRSLHSKRNHINRFQENDWTFEPLTRDNISECSAMTDVWCEVNECDLDPDKAAEICAVRRGLAEYFALPFIGGVLRVDGVVQAYTFGEKLCDDMFVVHVEKALTNYQGVYPAINYYFLNYLAKQSQNSYKYVNREEDMGIEGLRKAKLSYKPAFMVEKFSVTVKFS